MKRLSIQPRRFLSLSGIKPKFMHEFAKTGFQNAAYYESSRPKYPADILDEIANLLPKKEEISIVELGAGTGIFTELLINKFGADITSLAAVEPSEGFRKRLEERFPPSDAQPVKVVSATAEATGLESGSADMVVVAQAFHWMDTPETLNEVHRLLKTSDSPLVLVWNGYDHSIPWIKELEETIVAPCYTAGVPRYATGDWQHCFYDQTQSGKWARLTFHYSTNALAQTGSVEPAVDRVVSTSVVQVLSESERVRIAGKVRTLLENHPDTKGIKPSDLPVSYMTEMCYTFPNKEIQPDPSE